MREGKTPCLAMPGGSGKSVVNAEIIRQTMEAMPSSRILMVVRSQELVAQNARALRKVWPGAPAGVVCSSLGRQEWGEPVTIASTGSVARHADRLGHIDLFLIDEAQDMSHDGDSQIRKLVASLRQTNPAMRIGGYSASPYRLGQGLLTDGDDAIFDAILEPVWIQELLNLGKLMPLKSKHTTFRMDTTGVDKVNGDFVASQMEAKFNTATNNNSVVAEVLTRAASYRHWLVFCSGVDHARAVAAEFSAAGVTSDFVTAQDPKGVRKAKIAAFERGEVRALCNVGILTTGYDFPDLDCIVFLRDTMSPGLYLQSAVRGMRIKRHVDHCLVLDFVGVVARHGPVTNVEPPKKPGERKKNADAPMKVCEACDELVMISATECPACGTPFPPAKQERGGRTPDGLELRDDDIMGGDLGRTIEVASWHWRIVSSAKRQVPMIVVTHRGKSLSDPPVIQYLCVRHGGRAETKAWDEITAIASHVTLPAGVLASDDLDALCAAMTAAQHPRWLQYVDDGDYKRITRRAW